MLAAPDDLRPTVEGLLREQFPTVGIVDISVEEGVDHDGDDILYVQVVIDEDQSLGSHARLDFVRLLRNRLSDMHVERFPMLSFLTTRDREGRTASG